MRTHRVRKSSLSAERPRSSCGRVPLWCLYRRIIRDVNGKEKTPKDPASAELKRLPHRIK